MRTAGKKRVFRIVFLLFLGAMSLLCFIEMLASQASRRANAERATATAIAEHNLTERYGAEVSAAITHFELGWHSQETITDTKAMAEFATYPFLDMFGEQRRRVVIAYPTISWPVVKTAEVQWLRVLEYTPQRFKAVAAVSRVVDKVTLDNTVTETDVADPLSCGIYVFVREDDVWKLSDSFATSNATPDDLERDWYFADSVTKDIIGELPDGPLCTPWPWP
jgi:hypothetical protein